MLAAGASGSTIARTAWDQLAQAYWPPVYHHARRRGHTHEDAQDLVQGFFARLIDKAALRQAVPERGRFRSFLLASFEHFLANDHDHRQALKRGGAVEFVPLPEDAHELPATTFSGELGRAFDRADTTGQPRPSGCPPTGCPSSSSVSASGCATWSARKWPVGSQWGRIYIIDICRWGQPRRAAPQHGVAALPGW